MNDSLALQVELFADLTVRIDDPFGDRRQVLAAAGLDADGYEAVIASWRARFERDATGELSARFAEVYAKRRAVHAEQRRREASCEELAADPGSPVARGQSFGTDRLQAAHEPDASLPVQAPVPVASPARPAPVLEAPPDVASPLVAPSLVRPPERYAGTADISAFVPRAATPFVPASAAPRPPDPPAAAPVRPRIGSGTMDISAAVPHHILPFADRTPPLAPQPSAVAHPPLAAPPAPPPPAPAPLAEAAPRRRLIRFDPQTGQPLPSPVWVELPPEPGRNK